MEWSSNLSIAQWTGLVGGLFGSLVGVAAGAYALRKSLRDATSSAQRRRMWLFAGAVLAIVVAYLGILAVVSADVRPWLILPYIGVLWLLILAANRYAFNQNGGNGARRT